MLEINYMIKDELGIHARPAGRLVKLLCDYKCAVYVGTPEKMVDAKRIMGVMGLCLKQGDTMKMTFDGPDELEAAEAAKAFLEENL